MSNFIHNNIISDAKISFHNKNMPIELFSNLDEKFGKLAITIAKTKITKKSIFIKSTLDVSGSMDQISDKNGTRLDYVKRTLVKMLQFLATMNDVEIWIQIDSFSTTFNNVIEKVLLSPDMLDELIIKINTLTSDKMTNIELALSESNKIMESIISQHPEYKTVHLFLTDGEPTVGENTINTLVKLVNPAYSTVFIGYGTDHNSQLLTAFANEGIHNKYMFIDNFENTGLVYGEIVHALLYSAIEHATITMNEGSFIYDAKTNSWKESLLIPVLLSEKEYIYHIKTADLDNTTCIIDGNVYNEQAISEIKNEKEVLYIVKHNSNTYEKSDIDLSKYIFRQKTMELLYEATNINKDDKNYLKKKMKDFFRIMTLFMKSNNLQDDIFMKVLCEDIHISYTTLGSVYGNMLSASRNVSQREQTCYRSGSAMHKNEDLTSFNDYLFKITDNQIDNYIPKNKKIKRQSGKMFFSSENYNDYYLDENEQIEDDQNIDDFPTNPNDPYNIDNYNMEFITEDIYSTQEAISIIRGVSGV